MRVAGDRHHAGQGRLGGGGRVPPGGSCRTRPPSRQVVRRGVGGGAGTRAEIVVCGRERGDAGRPAPNMPTNPPSARGHMPRRQPLSSVTAEALPPLSGVRNPPPTGWGKGRLPIVARARTRAPPASRSQRRGQMPSSRRPAAGSFFLAPARARAVRPEHGGLVGVHGVAESPGHSTRCLRMPPRGPERGGGRRSRQHPAWPTGHLSRSVTGKPETRVPPARLPGSLSPPRPSPFRGGGAGIQTARRAIEVPFLAMDWAIDPQARPADPVQDRAAWQAASTAHRCRLSLSHAPARVFSTNATQPLGVSPHCRLAEASMLGIRNSQSDTIRWVAVRCALRVDWADVLTVPLSSDCKRHTTTRAPASNNEKARQVEWMATASRPQTARSVSRDGS